MADTGGRKRTRIQREYDLQEIGTLYLKGFVQAAIATHINKNRDYEVSQQTVSNDLKTLQKRWLDSSLTDYNEAKAQELAKIDNLERLAWQDYEASKDPIVRRKTAKKIDGQITEATQEVGGQGEGNTRFLEIVKWCIDRRIKLLGLDAPGRQEVTGKGGGPVELASIDLSTLSDEQLKRLAAGEDIANVVIDK